MNDDLPPIVKHFEILMNYMEYEKALKENKCPKCGEELINESGCHYCVGCGWSACDN